MPERLSLQVKETVTGPLFQPKLLGRGDREPERVGCVLSILMPPTVADAAFPALSVQVPVLD